MQIRENTVATIDYVLTDLAGKLIEKTDEDHPLSYLHGAGTLIPGLTSAMNGRQAGDRLQFSVEPVDAYGARDDGLCQKLDREQFSELDKDLAVGMRFRVPTDQGEVVVAVTEIMEDTVTVDANHPLAGVTLSFDVVVREVRAATPEEIEHGHVHGPGGHEH